jgi:ubiquinone/menaquinone biosynthesis C-methylase UbiE
MLGDAERLEFSDNEFDAVISISTFEHIVDIQKTLSEIRRVLKPYGRFYTSFMPIWTSVTGHHFIASGESTWNDEHLALIPPWGHLYMSQFQMQTHLESLQVGEALKQEILHFIYHSDIINHKSRQEISNALLNSEMIVRIYKERVKFSRFTHSKQSELTPEIADKIIAAGHTLSDAGVIGMSCILEKLSAC